MLSLRVFVWLTSLFALGPAYAEPAGGRAIEAIDDSF